MLSPRHRSARAGFTLIEIVIAVSILSILVGAAIPLTSKIVNSTSRRATLSELTGLSAAAEEYFTDTGVLPGQVGDLLVDPPVTGWTGPYVGGVTTDRLTGSSSFEVDGWSRAYTVAVAGDLWTCTSSGGDATFGTPDDIAVVLDVTGIRRRVSLERLSVINGAITRYNADWAATEPLPADYATCFARLVARGYLPNVNTYQLDGWGDGFTCDPPVTLPVVRATSPNL